MHIALIPLVFLPKYTGGGEVWMSGIARELHSKGHKVSILTAEDSAFQISGSVSKVQSYDDEWEGLPVRRLYFDKISTGQPSPWYDTTNPSIAEAVTSFLMDCRPDVVHLTCGQHLSASPILAAQAIGLPTVLTLIGFWYICPLTTLLRPDGNLCPGRKTGIECLSCLASRSRNSRVLKQLPHKFRSLVSAVNLQTMLLARASVSLQLVRAVDQRDAVFTEALRGVDRILAPSTALRDIFVQSGIIGADQIMYWPYSIEVAYASQGSDKSPSNVLRIGYTGHMLRQKGVDVLIKAVRNLSLDIPLQLRLYGALDKDMEYGKELVALASNDPRILFLGRFDNRRIGEILREIDVVVVPSIWMENSPVVIHEALAARTPVIATDLGGMADLIQHERNGLLFRRGDDNDLAEQIRRFVVDPGLLSRLGDHAHAVRSIEDEVAALEILYQNVYRTRRGYSDTN